MERWLTLALEHPGSAITALVAFVSVVGYAAVLLNNLKHMRDNMVTRKDLRIAMAEFQGLLLEDLNGTYVRQKECDLRHEK